MTNTTYEFTAFTEADLLDAGADGSGVNCGDTFTMSETATTCFEVTDDDAFLSGDNYSNENANDQYGQQAAITDAATGAEIGNGGQIYAEKYFWVSDDAGNWYVMLQIEQEGTGEEYFTFFNGYGYETPAEGTNLTVYSSCNVTSDWVDFKCLDAGEKGPETGSISGRVFCDDDCDGIDGGVAVIEGSDYTVEAEDMDAWGFKTVHGEYASGGELVRLQCAGQQAAIKTDFQGKDGVYDISLFIQDENDGASKIKLLVNGQVVEAIRLDRQSDGAGSNNGGFSEFVIEGVELKAGDEVKLWAEGNGYEFVRVDKIEFNGRDQEVRTEEQGKEGVVVVLLDANGNEVLDANGQRIETATDANGEYTFDGVPVGDYRVKFENPDGTEFTFQNAGSDDTIDSDVDGNGVSDVVSVVADQTTSDVDAGLKPVELGSIAGRYFCDENDDGTETDGAGNFEAGVAGATVWLILEGSGVIASTTTDADGNYSFGDLDAGNYSVRFEDPDDVSAATEGKNFIAADQVDDAIDSDVVDVGGAGNGNTVTFTLGAGENKTDVDAGIKQQFMVCDDLDAVLIDFEGFAAGTVIDDEYADIGVTISAQRINNNDAANNAMVFDSANPTGGDGDLQTFNQGNLLIVSEDNDSSDPDDAVGGVITFDFDNPSRIFDLKVVDTEEGGTVELFDANGNSLGVIDLPNLADGGLEQVMIDVDGVSQMVVTINGSGAIDDICIVPGEPAPGSLSGRYFFDADRDGLDNDGANGISGIQVELLDENGDPTGDTVMTDAMGNYSFGNLSAGDYGVKFTDPDTGRELTTQNVDMDASDDIDSDATDVGGGMSAINGITVVAGQDTPDNDAGVVELLGSLSGRYFCDDDGDGLDNGGDTGGEGLGVAGIRVDLLDANGQLTGIFTTTEADGSYSFENLSAGTYGVQFTGTPPTKDFTTTNVDNDVSDDIDSDAVANGNGTATIAAVIVVAGLNTANNDVGVAPLPGSLSGRYFSDADRDGLDNDGANGISGIQVELLDENGVGLGIFETTDGQGNYSFGDLDAGTYGVKFTDPDTGRELTTQNVDMDASDDIDSDAADVGGGMSAITGIVVVPGANTPDNDAGVVELLGSLSGRYFCDNDGDGFDNDGDTGGEGPGVAGIRVDLLDANGDETGQFTMTDAQGNYSFANLPVGTYGVRFAEGVLDKVLTIQNADNDVSDDIDSDAMADNVGFAVITNIAVSPGQNTPDNDVGVFPNQPPVVVDDAGIGCADELIFVDFSDNFSDPDSGFGGSASITMINGQAISQGQPVSVSILNDEGETEDVSVTLTADNQFIFDGEDAFAFLDIGEEETESFTVTVTDSIGASSQANIDVTFKGDANSVESLVASLPETIENIAFNGFLPENAFTAFIDGTGDARLDGQFFELAYCLERPADLVNNVFVSGSITAGIDSAVEQSNFTNTNVGSTLEVQDEDGNTLTVTTGVEGNLDLINWLVNQDFTSQDNGDGTGTNYTDAEVQFAIWGLTDGDPVVTVGAVATEDNIEELIALAIANGEGFEAGDGDLASFVFDPDELQDGVSEDQDHDQAFIVFVPFDDVDCIC